MKKNHLLLLLVVAVIVGLAGIYFQNSQSAGWRDSRTDRTILQHLPINDIAAIKIRSAPATVTLEKKHNEWGVAERSDYPADFSKIRDLVKMLWELKAGQEMQIGPSQLDRLNLIAPGQGTGGGIEIDLKGEKEQQIASLIIGKSMDRNNAASGSSATGRFVYDPAVKDRVYLVSESFFSVDPVNVGSWLDKTFIIPGEVKEVDQSAWSNNPGWKVIRKDLKAEWQLEGLQPGESLDKSYTQNLSTFAPTFVDVRPPSISPDESGFKDPFRISVKTFDGFTYDFVIGKEGPDKARYLQLSVSADLPSARIPEPNESAQDKQNKDGEFAKKIAGLKERLEKEKRFEKWVYLVPDWNLEHILKRRDEIVSKATPSPSPASSLAPEAPSSPLPTQSSVEVPTPKSTPTSDKMPESLPSASSSLSASPSPTPALSPTP
ncbi:MAG: DUF4340 domain-containing protein [Verrucomicrobia bacterium]|nr:DUF4340 domain-containing protein [Verrucomicrobiota bacterium]